MKIDLTFKNIRKVFREFFPTKEVRAQREFDRGYNALEDDLRTTNDRMEQLWKVEQAARHCYGNYDDFCRGMRKRIHEWHRENPDAGLH